MPLNWTHLRELVAAIGIPPEPLPRPGPPRPESIVQVVSGPGSAGLKLAGVELWSVDARLFAGTPTVTVTAQLPGGARIELKGARYPGTGLPADFVLTLGRRTPAGTPLSLTMTLGGFAGHAIAELWLAGDQTLESPVSFAITACPLGALGKLALAGPAQAVYQPAGTLDYLGAGIAGVSGISPQLISSDSLSLRVLPPGTASISAAPRTHRSLLSLRRDGHGWSLVPPVLALATGILEAHDDLFDHLDVEAGEDGPAAIDHTLAAQSNAHGRLVFLPGGGISALDGGAARLPLDSVRLAIDFEAGESFLGAYLVPEPVWVQVDGYALQLGRRVGPPQIEVDVKGGVVTHLACSAHLVQAAAPLAGDAAASPLLLGLGRLEIVASPGASPGWGLLAAPARPGRPRLSLPGFAVALQRPADLLALELTFFNLALEGGNGQPARLVRIAHDQDALIAVRFNAPQNLAEQAFPEPGPVPTAAPVQVLAAGPSQLVFRLPAALDGIDYTLAALLDWTRYDPNLAAPARLDDPPAPPQPQPAPPPPRGRAVADTTPAPRPAPPAATETAIEAPWHLFLSPNPTGGWAHAAEAVSHGAITELWHTRLGVRRIEDGRTVIDERDASTRTVRAIWSTEYVQGAPPVGRDPFLMSLTANWRDQIVALSADFGNPALPPRAIGVDRLMLSTLGAWLDVDGHWAPQPPFDIEEWKHRAALGRDHYVKVVQQGFLACFGHRAALITITERKFLNDPTGHTAAYLMQRQFIVVREPVKDYGYLGSATAHQGRDFPFVTVRLTTLVTPNLDPVPPPAQHFIPRVGGLPVLFHVVATDREGQVAEFTAPLVWGALGHDGEAMNEYAAAGPDFRRRDLAGQLVAFAPSSRPGDTSLHTRTLAFQAALLRAAAGPPHGQPAYYPQLDPFGAAEVVVPAIQQMTGVSTPITISLYDDYVTRGFGKGGVFAALASGLAVGFNGQQSGGVATPNLQVGGLSRTFGTVSGVGNDLKTFADGSFDPAAYFGAALDAKLLGFVKLTDIIALIGDVTGAPDKVPKFLTHRLPDRIVSTLAWKPGVNNWDGGFARLSFDPAEPVRLELDVTLTTLLQGGGSVDAAIAGHLRSFALELAGVVKLPFKSVDFQAGNGRKLDLSADVGDLEFEGDLTFLNTLKKLIPAKGFSDPPYVDVTTRGVTVGYSLDVPSVGVGVFSLENIRLAAAIELSFINDPVRFRFAFSERQHPFLVTVSLLGGGGFFALELGPDGVEVLEASIEFGANVSLDLVVASANVHIMAGVYLRLDSSHQSQLTGFLRAGGSAEVLGLISVSVEFYLGFTYYFGHGTDCKIAGEATLTVQVDVLFFSASVSLSFRREFADPRIGFADLISANDWDDYCDAFAA